MTSTIYGYGDGWILELILNGVAMLTGGGSNWLYEIAAKVGFLAAAVYAAAKSDYKHTAKWLAWYAAAMAVFFVPKTTVLIEDLVTKDKYAVKGIPVAMGEMASIVSTASYDITRTFESVFKVPGALQYGTSGLAFASKVMEDANHITIKNADIRGNYHGYVSQCVFYDILLGGKYTYQELLATGDIWEMLESHASPVRRFTYVDSKTRKATLPTCKEGLAMLKTQWKKIIDDTGIIWGKKYFHGSNQEAKVALLEGLEVADHYLGGASRDASDIIKQKLLTNVIRDGFENNAARLDNAAMMQKLAADRAYMQQRSSYNILGEMAGKALVGAKGIFEAIIYAMFPMVIIFSLASLEGHRVLFTYLRLLIWINTWPLVYAVINMVMSVEGVFRVGAATATGMDSISWGASEAMHNIHSDIASQAGFLSMSVPWISQALMQKGEAAFTHLAGHLGGTSQAAAGKYAGMASDGDIVFANRNYENVSRNNGGMFNVNKSSAFDYGTMSSNRGQGIRETSGIGGQTSYQVDKSNMHNTVNTSEGISSEASNRAAKSFAAAKSQATQAMNHEAAAHTSSLNMLKEFGRDVGTKGSWANRLSAQQQKVFADTRSKLKQHGINVDEMDSKALIGAGKAFAKGTVGGALAKLGGVEVGGELSTEFRGDTSTQNKYTKLEQAAKNSDLRKSLEAVEGASQDISFSEGETDVKKMSDSIGSNLTKSKSLQTQSDASLRKAQNYDKTASLARTRSGILTQNHDQAIANRQNKLVNTPLGQGGISQAEYNAWKGSDPVASKKALSGYIDEISDNIRNNAAIKSFATPKELEKKYNNDSQQIKQDNNIEQTALDNNAQIKKAGLDVNIDPDQGINTGVKDQALRNIATDQEQIFNREEQLNLDADKIVDRVENEQDKSFVVPESLRKVMSIADDINKVGGYAGMPSANVLGNTENNTSTLEPDKKIIDTGTQNMMVDKGYIEEDLANISGGKVVRAGDRVTDNPLKNNSANDLRTDRDGLSDDQDKLTKEA